MFTVAAAASKDEPAQNGDVVVPADGRPALWAARAWMDDRLTLGQARDADVQEAAEDQAEDEADNYVQDERDHD